MATFSHPRSARLRRRAEFARVVRRGRLFAGAECVVRVLPNDTGRARLGMAAPRRYGRSVRRNRFRRIVREAFRSVAQDLGALDVMVAPRKGLSEPTLGGVRADLLAAGRHARRGAPRKSAADDAPEARP